MMYSTFLNAVQQKLQNHLGSGYNVVLRRIAKNNGLILDGLSIGPSDQNIAPTFYLNQYFPFYQKGVPLDSIVWDILSAYKNAGPVPPFDVESITDFKSIGSKVAFKLIHTASNTELLKQIPHIPFLDLSIVFYILLEHSKNHVLTAIVHNEHQKIWDISISQLYDLAKANTPRILPAILRPVDSFTDNSTNPSINASFPSAFDGPLSSSPIFPAPSVPLYVLTNSSGINGAGAILYPDIIKDFANAINRDLILLPSSVNEILLFPYWADSDFQMLSQLVTSTNQSKVAPQEFLSNEVYMYTRSDGQISMASYHFSQTNFSSPLPQNAGQILS